MALRVPEESYATVQDVQRRVQQVFPDGLPGAGGEELNEGDIELFLKEVKRWIDGQLRRLGAPFGIDRQTVVDLLAPINADGAAERAFAPYLTNRDLNQRRATSYWRRDLADIREGKVDLDDEDDNEFLGFTGGKSFRG